MQRLIPLALMLLLQACGGGSDEARSAAYRNVELAGSPSASGSESERDRFIRELGDIMSGPVTQVRSVSRSASFEECVGLIQNTAGEIGIAPTNLVETNVMRMVRFNLDDGSVLMTCSRPDNRLVVTRSPHAG